MPKGYIVNSYRVVNDAAALAAYAKLAGPAILAAGGRFIVRGLPVKTFEAGIVQRTVVVEFDSVEQAIAAYDSPAYQEAVALLGDSTERDMRIVAGAE